jgi:hypothetical protein
MDEWKPIETAPKDGTRIRVLRGDLQDTVEWFHPLNDWLVERDPDGVHHVLLSWQPTHWMPSDLAVAVCFVVRDHNEQ